MLHIRRGTLAGLLVVAAEAAVATGLPGLAVDAITGGLYKLKPEQVQATLEQSTAAIGERGDVMVVAVVLRTDPEWERIGGLSRK